VSLKKADRVAIIRGLIKEEIATLRGRTDLTTDAMTIDAAIAITATAAEEAVHEATLLTATERRALEISSTDRALIASQNIETEATALVLKASPRG